ncbi:DUF2059 domain-containing protein [Pseudodesulfovibrio sp.]|uniref:DUF2059 domain-containing protein n=1 Tax=unclassified Pseudodesulfovibrio TaxID=2661612 RepID=UPI003B00DA8D
MKKILLCLPIILALLTAGQAYAQQSKPAEKPSPKEMMAMLKVSGSVEVLDQLVNQLIVNLEQQVKKEQPDLPKEAYPVIKEEFESGLRAWMKTLLVRQMEYYSQYMTRTEVLDLTRMYKSTAYKKMIDVGEKYIITELQPILQKEVPLITDQINQRVKDRLAREGIIKNKKAGI